MSAYIKYSLLLCILFSRLGDVQANNIDSLSSKENVLKFLVGKIDTPWHSNDSPMPEIDTFFKADIDNNGLTDLLLKWDTCFAVLNKGNGQYDIRSIYAGEKEQYKLVGLFYVEDTTLLIVRSFPFETHKQYNRTIQNDTLIFKFGDFIEYNVHSPDIGVEEILLKIDNGYPGRNWDLKVQADGWATFEINRGKRIFAGIIDSMTFNNLVQTINYIDIPKLIEKEAKMGPGGPSTMSTATEIFTLTVKYNDGNPITIYDLGGQYTYGLKNLYKQLLNLVQGLPEIH